MKIPTEGSDGRIVTSEYFSSSIMPMGLSQFSPLLLAMASADESYCRDCLPSSELCLSAHAFADRVATPGVQISSDLSPLSLIYSYRAAKK